MKNILITFVLLLGLIISASAQSTKVGLQVDGSYEHNSTKFNYKREYSQSGDSLFITTYKIYGYTSGAHLYTVTAEHYKNKKLIIVTNSEAEEGLFSNLGKVIVNLDYEEPSSKPFGKVGVIRGVNGSGSPHLCSTQFISKKFENVNVLEIQVNLNNQLFFLLDSSI